MEKARAAEFIPEIQSEIQLGGRGERAAIRRGYLELMDAMPNAMKMDCAFYRVFVSSLSGSLHVRTAF